MSHLNGWLLDVVNDALKVPTSAQTAVQIQQTDAPGGALGFYTVRHRNIGIQYCAFTVGILPGVGSLKLLVGVMVAPRGISSSRLIVVWPRVFVLCCSVGTIPQTRATAHPVKDGISTRVYHTCAAKVPIRTSP